MSEAVGAALARRRRAQLAGGLALVAALLLGIGAVARRGCARARRSWPPFRTPTGA